MRVSDKAQLLRELSRRAAAAVSIDQNVIYDALLARENLGSTAGLFNALVLEWVSPKCHTLMQTTFG